MAKQKYKGSCSCEDIEFSLSYLNDEPKEIYCPFCGTLMEDEDDFDNEDE